jgi:hypothetical protein
MGGGRRSPGGDGDGDGEDGEGEGGSVGSGTFVCGRVREASELRHGPQRLRPDRSCTASPTSITHLPTFVSTPLPPFSTRAGGEGGHGGGNGGGAASSGGGPPRKKLSCVAFAENNAHVLLTGDAAGGVDVYRIVGLTDAAAGGGGGGAGDVLSAAVGGGAAAAAVGSEEHEAQLEALNGVLAGFA